MGSKQRPLSELSPVAQRRNSPSWSQHKGIVTDASSPFDSSPFNASQSPRQFWQGRDTGSPFRMNSENKYDPEGSVSPSKRSSIENLKKASRVKNSSMFARESKNEYDPTQVQLLERPLASGRPLSMQFPSFSQQQNGVDARRQLPSQSAQGKTTTGSPLRSPIGGIQQDSAVPSPLSRNRPSPTKSSMSRGGRFGQQSTSFDPESDIWTDEEDADHNETQNSSRSLNRMAKSVTFDAAPPQINEYEMTTPDPSSIASSSREGSYDSADLEEEESFDRGSSIDRDDSFDASLEDTEKTPVVLPDEWRFMSPANANDELVQGEDDPFSNDYGSPEPDVRPSSARQSRSLQSRIESVDSNGERRPLPPLPPTTSNTSPEHGSLAATMERASGAHRQSGSPMRPASYSKEDIGHASMSLEDRVRLMMVSEQRRTPEAEKQRERRMRRAGAKEKALERESENKHSLGSPSSLVDEQEALIDMGSSPPRISRESILRNISNQPEENHPADFSSPGRTESEYRVSLDPDVPIPSLEDDQDNAHDFEEPSVIKEEEDDTEIDLHSIPQYYPQYEDHHSEDGSSETARQDEDNSSSRYSNSSNHDEEPSLLRDHDDTVHEEQATPVPHTFGDSRSSDFNPEPKRQSHSSFDASEHHQFDIEPLSYVDQSSTVEKPHQPAPALDMAHIRNSLQRPETPDYAGDGYGSSSDPESPQSVIRHPISESPLPEDPEPEPIPDNMASVKAPGGSLKTRPSLTPADAESMAAARRRVSGQDAPPVPSLPNNMKRESVGEKREDGLINHHLQDRPHGEFEQRQSSLVKLDIPISGSEDNLGFGLDREFDRLLEAQKVKGYLTRQNTKVIVASSRVSDDGHGTTDEPAAQPGHQQSASLPASPRKSSQQTWTTEPWNGKTRRQSIKVPGGVPRKKPVGGPVPPLPGQESNVKDGIGADDAEGHPHSEEFADGEERGRLFVKVVGVKDLDLPLPRGQRSYFSLTLDNGLHCVTTSWLELGKSAPIGQEFELVVQGELEFQLTLQMKMDLPKPPISRSVPASPAKAGKPSAFGRMFASPKKRKEVELRQQQEEQQRLAEEKAFAERMVPWDRLRTLVAADGSFARSYVSLADYEKHAFGRPASVDVIAFNEWASDPSMNTMKGSKKSNPAGSGTQRRPPYKIGNLELQLLYVPKPKGATEEDMPKSMNACIREMREADNTASRCWEGFLSQQGGDCPYWRRRYFKLSGTKLTAYHEVTRQPRATINLAKASKLIDDKSILTQKETSAKGGGRRKSAFAEEEEGYMFVEEGFRIRFGNGEVIDFYADSAAEKDGWMQVLAETVGKGYAAGSGQIKPWTELVLRRERAMVAKQQDAADRRMSRPAAQTQTNHTFDPKMMPPPPVPAPKPRPQHHSSQSGIVPPPQQQQQQPKHQKTRSLIF